LTVKRNIVLKIHTLAENLHFLKFFSTTTFEFSKKQYSKQNRKFIKLSITDLLAYSSCVCIMSHNWSAKQQLHRQQNVTEKATI